MEKKGILQRRLSIHNSPIVAVRKKSGKIRICNDFRKLNDLILDPIITRPPLKYVCRIFYGSRVFSCLDLCSAFYSIPIRIEDWHFTAFNMEGLTFEYTSLPMGIKSSGSFLTFLMGQVLGELWRICVLLFRWYYYFFRKWREAWIPHRKTIREISWVWFDSQH